MKKLLFILLIPINLIAQQVDFKINYVNNCDQLQLLGTAQNDTVYSYWHPTLHDSIATIYYADNQNYFTVYQKCDTCNNAHYNCEQTATQAIDYVASFQGSDVNGNAIAGRMYNFGTTSTFNYMHRTGVFRIKFTYIINYSIATAQILLSTRTTTGNGIYLLRTGNNLLIQFGSNSATILNSSWANVFIPMVGSGDDFVSNRYEIILIGDGTGIQLFCKKANGASIDFGKLNFTGGIVNSGNQSTALAIGGTSTANSLIGMMTNMKIYSTSDTTTLFADFPMNNQATLNIETVQNLTGTISNVTATNIGTVTIVTNCLLQGWKVIANAELSSDYRIDLFSVNKIIYLYVSIQHKCVGSPSITGCGERSYFYLMIRPKKVPVKMNYKLLKNSKRIYLTKHNIYLLGQTF